MNPLDYHLPDLDPDDLLPAPQAPSAPASAAIAPRLLNYRQARDYLGGISEGTLRSMVKTGCISPIRLLGAVRFDLADLDAWIEAAKGRVQK